MNLRFKFVSIGLIVNTTILFLAHQALALEGSIAFQGGFAQALPNDTQKLKAVSGVDGYAYLDLKLAPSISFGVGTGFTAFIKGGDRLYVDGTHLIARFSPFTQSDWMPYLIGGVGFRPFYQSDPNHRWWPGNFQSLAGLGVRHPLVPGIDLDATAFYDGSSNNNDLLSSVGARAGLAFPFGGDGSGSGQAKNSHNPGNDRYSWKQGDSTKKLALKLYGDAIYADALIDANSKLWANGRKPAPGDQLVTPSLNDMNIRLHNLNVRVQANGSIYKVRRGDCLWGISQKNYGVGHEWLLIYHANQKKIADPNLIYPQQKLRVPGPISLDRADQEN